MLRGPFLVGIVVVVCVAVGGCGRESKHDAPLRGQPSTPAAVKAALSPTTNRDFSRKHCSFGAGALARDTLDVDEPFGAAIPIQHFVVVMQENRSFDQYFAKLGEQGGPAVDVAPKTYFNEARGRRVQPFLLNTPCVEDVPHEWNHVHEAWNGGKMNGFLRAAGAEGDRVLGYYDSTLLPYYYALGSTFPVADNYHADVLGPTWPNRMYFLAGTSFGHIGNTPPPLRDEERSLFHLLESRGLSWAVYAESLTFEEEMFPRLHFEKGKHFLPLSQYFVDAERGELPAFAWVESTFGTVLASDEHPPADIEIGQAFVAKAIDALFHSPNWHDSALFWTYDEGGGFFDHQPPPEACPPGELPPRLGRHDVPGDFQHLGVRVQMVAVSPFARRHYAAHHTYSHASLLRLVEARFDLPALTSRDANARVPFEMFDFSRSEFATPPNLPTPSVNSARLAECEHSRVGERPRAPHE